MNTEYQSNSKLTGPECPKNMKLNNWSGAMPAAKNAAFIEL